MSAVAEKRTRVRKVAKKVAKKTKKKVSGPEKLRRTLQVFTDVEAVGTLVTGLYAHFISMCKDAGQVEEFDEHLRDVRSRCLGKK